MGDLEYSGLLYADRVFRNEYGEPVLSIKRKDNYGTLYYVFEIREENLTPRVKKGVYETLDFIKESLNVLGIPLFDSKELMDGITGTAQRVLASKEAKKAIKKATKTGKVTLVKDVNVMVFNHATGKIHSLTIGVSVPPNSEDAIKEMLKGARLK